MTLKVLGLTEPQEEPRQHIDWNMSQSKMFVTVYVCTNPVLTLYCVGLHSGPLVVLSLLPLS